MSVRLKSSTTQFVMLSTDRFPMPGQLGQDGETPAVGAWPEGSRLTVEDTGESYIWLQDRWRPVGDPVLKALGEMQEQLKQLNKNVEALVAQRGGQ